MIQGYEKSHKKWYNLLFPTCQSHTGHCAFRDTSLLSYSYSTKWGLVELEGSEDFHMNKQSRHKFSFIQYFLLVTPHSFTYFDDCFVVASILLSYILGFLSMFLLFVYHEKIHTVSYISNPILPCLFQSLLLIPLLNYSQS